MEEETMMKRKSSIKQNWLEKIKNYNWNVFFYTILVPNGLTENYNKMDLVRNALETTVRYIKRTTWFSPTIKVPQMV